MTDPNTFAMADGGRVTLAAGGAAILRHDAFGLSRWTVQPIDAGDAFVDLAVDDDGLVRATSWRGVAYVIEPNTGAVLLAEFVK